ncbi:transglutaminase domain-containing protein, partial [bacterium]|nr:transglutaminase domain-containing protein [bacterium]
MNNLSKQIIKLVLISIILLLPARALFAEESIINDYWAQIFYYNQKAGYLHRQLKSETVNGQTNYCLTVDFTSIPEKGGGVHRENLIVKTDKSFRIISFQNLKIDLNEKISISGNNENGVLKVKLERNGYSVTKEFLLGDDVFSAACIENKIALGSGDTGREVFKVFDENTLLLSERKIKLTKKRDEQIEGKAIKVYEIEEDDSIQPDIRVKCLVEENGAILSLRSDELNYSVVKSTKSEAENFTKEISPSLPRLMPIDTFFLSPEGLEYLKIKVVQEKPYAIEGIFNDPRQKLVKTNNKDEYSLIINSKPNDISEILKQKPAPDNISDYLTDSIYLTLADEKIVTLSRDLAKPGQDSLSIIRNISSWIKSNINKETLLEPLSAAEVLKHKQGDCTEHALLFCALARSAGIPTKISVGVSYGYGEMIGHMWNECWIDGRWVPVDTTLNQIGIDSAHIKFLETDLDYSSLALFARQFMK